MENKWVQNQGKLVKTFQFKDFKEALSFINKVGEKACLLYTSPSPRDRTRSRMPSSA